MSNLLLDQDVQLVVLTFVIFLIIHAINELKLKYKQNWRYWLGSFLSSMGLASFLLSLFRRDKYFISALIWIAIGLVIWLFHSKKIEEGI